MFQLIFSKHIFLHAQMLELYYCPFLFHGKLCAERHPRLNHFLTEANHLYAEVLN